MKNVIAIVLLSVISSGCATVHDAFNYEPTFSPESQKLMDDVKAKYAPPKDDSLEAYMEYRKRVPALTPEQKADRQHRELLTEIRNLKRSR